MGVYRDTVGAAGPQPAQGGMIRGIPLSAESQTGPRSARARRGSAGGRATLDTGGA